MEPCKYEKEILEMSKGIARIEVTAVNLDKRVNGSYEKMAKHISEGDGWRKTIVGIVITLFITIAIQVVGFAFFFGKICKTVDVIEKRQDAWQTRSATRR